MDIVNVGSAHGPRSRKRGGFALISALVIVVIVGALLLGSAVTTQIEMALTRNDISATQAQYLAQAGLQTYKAMLFQSYRYVVAEAGEIDSCASILNPGLDLFRGPDGFVTWQDNRIGPFRFTLTDGDGAPIGDYLVEFLRDPNQMNRITIRSQGITAATGRLRAATSTASATFIVSTGSALENAIFAGTGVGGEVTLRGSAKVYGGVYIEGDEANSDVVVMGSSGSYDIFNGYASSDFASKYYAIPNLLDEPNVANLCASLRVQHGKVIVGQAVSVGRPDNKVLNVAVGQLGDVTYHKTVIDEADADSGTKYCSRNFGICSESPVSAFDLSDDPPTFPRLDEIPADRTLCPTEWRQCLDAEAAADGLTIDWNAGTDTPILRIGGVAIDVASDPAANQCLDWLRSGPALQFGTSDIDCRFSSAGGQVGFAYTYNSGTGTGSLSTLGHLNFEGYDLRFNERTEYTTSSVGGNNSTLFVEAKGGTGGNLVVTDDFVSSASFPSQVLAIVVEDEAVFAGGNGSVTTAPVYAGTSFRLRANNTFFGQIISDDFCFFANEGTPNDCNAGAGGPAIVFSQSRSNQPASFQAISTPGGTPTFTIQSYEMR